MAVADVNHDGKTDIIVANSSTISVLLGNGAAAFSLVSQFNTNTTEGITLGVADVNGDGNVDIMEMGNAVPIGPDEIPPRLRLCYCLD